MYVKAIRSAKPLGAALGTPLGQFLDGRNANAQLDDMHIDPGKN